jgi:hypothetical protein
VSCDDKDPCTLDKCDATKGGCLHAPDPKVCDDGNSCTADICQKDAACQHVAKPGPCDDKDPCSYGDACTGTACKSNPAVLSKTYALSSLAGQPYMAVNFKDLEVSGDAFLVVGSVVNPPSGDSMPSFDSLVIKLDSAGGVLWQQVHNLGKTDEFYAAAPVPDGGLVAVGRASPLPMPYEGVALVARLDKNGAALWSVKKGDGALHSLDDVTPTTAGSVAAAGVSRDTASGTDRSYLLVLDKDGATLIEAKVEGNPVISNRAHAILALPDGFVLAGEHVGLGGVADGWVARLDATGQLLWDRSFGGTAADLLYAAARLPDGGLALVGAADNPGVGTDLWALALDPKGYLRWQQQGASGGSGGRIVQGLVTRGGLDLVAAGQQGSFGPNGGSSSGFLVAFDALGRSLWANNWGWPAAAYSTDLGPLAAVRVLPDGRLAAVGVTACTGGGMCPPQAGLLVVTGPAGQTTCAKGEGGFCSPTQMETCAAANKEACMTPSCSPFGCGAVGSWAGTSCGSSHFCGNQNKCEERFAGSTILSGQQQGSLNDLTGSGTGKWDQKWKLCYRRSKDGASVEAFTKGCGNKGPAVVAIRTTNGHKLAAWNPVGWSGVYTWQASSQAFLYSFDRGAKLAVTDPTTAVYGATDAGIWFGEGPDLKVAPDMTTLTLAIGKSYDCPAEYGSPICDAFLARIKTGALVDEIEVFVKDGGAGEAGVGGLGG